MARIQHNQRTVLISNTSVGGHKKFVFLWRPPAGHLSTDVRVRVRSTGTAAAAAAAAAAADVAAADDDDGAKKEGCHV